VERATLYRQLQEVTESLRAALAITSHDIAGPLATIGAAVELLQRHHLDPEVTVLSRLIRNGHRHAVALARDLVSTSELGCGTLSAHREVFSVDDILDDARLASGYPASTFPVEGDTSIVLFADRGHVQSILANLISNANKYGTPPWSIHVGRDRFDVVISVADSGGGVPPEFVPRLFQRHARADSATEKAAGSGLGLWIAQSLAELNGGHIAYRGSGSGATFTVTLPSPDREERGDTDPTAQEPRW
jgi:signal transduction histidine kinase